MGSARKHERSAAVVQNQLSVLAERVNVVVAGVQRQGETDRRRLTQLERKLEARLEDRTREGDGREKQAEIQGSVNGLIEEVQALTRRVESLDERLWARTSGSELTKQRNRELEQQVQGLEQQMRHGVAAMEETHKRQATKQRRSEHALEDAQRRLAKVEEEVRAKQQAAHPRDSYLEARLGTVEQQQERLDSEVHALQMQLDEGGAGTIVPQDEGGEAGEGLEEAIRAAERGLGALEKKVSGQVEDLASSLASIRVKVDGQLQRLGTLAERLQTAHEPAMESLRAEFAQARQQDRRELDSELASLRSRIQEATEASDEAVVDTREALRQTSAQIAALSLRPEDLMYRSGNLRPEENPMLNNIDERLAVQEQELCELRARLDTELQAMGAKVPEDEELDDVRRRLEWLEEQGAAGAASDRADHRQAQNTICELVEGVSRLRQQASSSESSHSALQQQVSQLQSMLERRWSDEAAASARVPVEVEAKVGEMWEKVAELHARLLEVEGGLDFARENDDAPAEAPVVAKDGGRSAARGEGGAHEASAAPATPLHDRSTAEMKEKLEAVAEHLEILDELADRMTELERRTLSPETGGHLVSSPAQNSEVSFGGDAPIRDLGSKARDAFSGSGTSVAIELQSRLTASEQELKCLREGLSKQEMAGQRLEVSAKRLSEQVVSLVKQVRQEKDAARQAGEGLGVEIQARVTVSEQDLQALKEKLEKQALTEQRLEALEAATTARQEELTQQLEGLVKQTALAKTQAADVDVNLDPLRHRISSLEVIVKRNEGQAGSGENLVERFCSLEELVKSSIPDEQVRLQVQRQVEELTTKVEGELGRLVDHQRDLAETKLNLKELSEQLPCREDLGVSQLARRLCVVEERLVGGDETERLHMQEQVHSLQAQISRELEGLASFQGDLKGAWVSIQAGRDQVEALQGEADALKGQMERACQRLESAEGSTLAVRRDLEQMQATMATQGTQGPRRVGISMGVDADPVALLRQRVDLLSDQLSDLQHGGRGRAGPRSAQSSRSPAPHSRSPPVSREASLNFSLTEQTDKPDGSLNFSVTESRQDLSFSESGACRREGDFLTSGSSDVPASSLSADSKASTTSSLISGKRSLLNELPELKGHRSSGGDVLDSLVGGGSSSSLLGGRVRPSPLRVDTEERGPLAPVVEESSDLGEASWESSRSQGRQRLRATVKSPTEAPLPESPGGSAASLDNSRSNLEAEAVSASFHEVSNGHDYSVENSQELDKCDHVEPVKPKVLPKLQEGRSTSASSLASKPKAGAASSAGVLAKKDDENEYGDESFDGASDSESIAESVDCSAGSGSGGGEGWGNGEDV